MKEKKNDCVNVRTTNEELDKYRKIKQTLSIYRAKVDEANDALKAAYKAENRPMFGTLETPGLFEPESAAIRKADANHEKAVDTYIKVYISLGGYEEIVRMRQFEIAGLI